MRGLLCLLRLLATQWESPARLRRRQEAGLVRLVHHAYARVPYYRRLFDDAGLNPADIRGLDDLPRIPVSTKQDLQQAPREDTLASGTNPAHCRRVRTSGTTGTPLETVLSRADASEMNASFLRAHRAWGMQPWDRLASLDFRPEALRQRSWYESLGLFRKLRLPSSAAPSQWIDALTSWHPRLLQGYSVTLQLLAEAVAASGRSDVRVPFVVSTSCTLTPAARAQIAGALHARVIDIYASVEAGGVIAWECPVCEAYHVDADRLIVELLHDGRPAAPGEEGDVVITSLGNYSTPFIRYRHGDLAVRSDRAPRCGRHLPLWQAVLGREADCLVLPSGARFNPHALGLAMNGSVGVGEWRVTQTVPGRLLVELAVRPSDAERTAVDVVRALQRYAGEPLTIEVRRMDRIPVDPSRKLRPILSLVGASEPAAARPGGAPTP